MSDPLTRLIVVTAAALAVALVWYWSRRRAGPARSLRSTGLGPGTYLFSSETCVDCSSARERLDGALGSDGYQELAWEAHRALFDALGIDQVPSTLVVDGNGKGRWHLGVPVEKLEPGNP
jgi:hypothetical protein